MEVLGKEDEDRADGFWYLSRCGGSKGHDGSGWIFRFRSTQERASRLAAVSFHMAVTLSS